MSSLCVAVACHGIIGRFLQQDKVSGLNSLLWFARVVFFFFQAEDGIRDDLVTGVQTCALPIYHLSLRRRRLRGGDDSHRPVAGQNDGGRDSLPGRAGVPRRFSQERARRLVRAPRPARQYHRWIRLMPWANFLLLTPDTEEPGEAAEQPSPWTS